MQNITSSLAELAGMLRQKRITAQELTQSAIDSYTKSEHWLNAYKAWDGDRAMAQAKAVDSLLGLGVDTGALMGIPVSVKDMYSVPYFPTYAGSALPIPQELEKIGPVVHAVQSQAGIIMGKTHTVEYAFGGLGCNAHWGSPRNPWSKNVARVSGGSSSGAGASLAQGSALVALGTDTGGSIRIPAAMTGQVGLKSTVGRLGTEGIFPLSTSFDTVGIMCRTVKDVCYAFQAFDNTVSKDIISPNLLGIRIGVPRNFFWEGADASITARIEEAISCLSLSGVVSKEIEVANCDECFEIFGQGGLAASEFYSFITNNYPERIEHMDINVYERFNAGAAISSSEYIRRKTVLKHYGESNLHLFNDVDVIVTPTVAINTPCDDDLVDASEYAKHNIMALRNTSVVNLFGWCALSLPVGLDHNGMPVGLHLIAPPFQEEKLLSVALAFEDLFMTSLAPRQTMLEMASYLI